MANYHRLIQEPKKTAGKQIRGRSQDRNTRQTTKRYFCTSESRSIILDCNTAGQGILDACRSQAKESG